MSTLDCDVLVVGAGPAGCSAARSAARKGLNTIFIDKKEEIGKPVQCAEGIGEFLFPYMPFEIPKEQLIWKMDGMFFWTDDICIEKKGYFWNSYSIHRIHFDKWLSKQAISEGARLLTNTVLTDLDINHENYVKKATVQTNEKIFDIQPKIIIAADGVESTVLNLLGLYNPKKGDLAEVYSWEMENLDLYKPNLEQIFTGEFTPSGYAYVFPKSKKTANIGVGGINPEKKLELYFEEFLEIPHLKKQVKNAHYVIEKSKKAAWNNLTDKWIYGNVILTGDVANQNLKPFIEGILPSIICGDIAGSITIDFFQKDIDNSKYQDLVKNKLGEHYIFSNELLDMINYLYAKKTPKKYLQFFAMITELFSKDDLVNSENMDYDDLKSKILRLKDGL